MNLGWGVSQGVLVCHLGRGGERRHRPVEFSPSLGEEKRGLGGLFLRSLLQPLLLLEAITFCCHGNSAGQRLTSLRMITFWQIK